MSEWEVWVTNGNGTDCFIVGGLTKAEATIVQDNIEYGIDVQAWIKATGVADSENRSTPREQVRAILIDRRWVLDPTADLEETLDEIDAAYGVETKLRDTWYRTDGVAVEDSLCIWCLRRASLCVIVDPCGDRESYEDERWSAVHGVETR